MSVINTIKRIRAHYVANRFMRHLDDSIVGVTLKRIYRENIRKQPGGVNIWVGSGIDLDSRQPIYVEGYENNGKFCITSGGRIILTGNGNQEKMNRLSQDLLKAMAVFIECRHTPVIA